MADATFVDFEQGPVPGAATSVAFDWGNIAGEADDDVAIAAIYREVNQEFSATPAGWFPYATWLQVGSTPDYRIDVYWRRRSGDAGAVTWTWATSAFASLMGFVFRGLITTENPLLPQSPSVKEESAQNTQPSHPGIEIRRRTSTLLHIIANFTGVFTGTPQGGFSEVQGTDREIYAQYDLSTVPGPSGVVAATLTDAEWASSILIELVTMPGLPEQRSRARRPEDDDEDERQFNEVDIRYWWREALVPA